MVRSFVAFCSFCGSFDVQQTAWVRPNKGDAIVADDPPTDDAWCNRCSREGREGRQLDFAHAVEGGGWADYFTYHKQGTIVQSLRQVIREGREQTAAERRAAREVQS